MPVEQIPNPEERAAVAADGGNGDGGGGGGGGSSNSNSHNRAQVELGNTDYLATQVAARRCTDHADRRSRQP